MNEQYKIQFKLLLYTSLPIVGTMTSGMIMMLIDRVSLARYSVDTLIASGPAIYIAMAIMAFFITSMNLTRTFVAQSNGSKNKEKISDSAKIGIYAAILLGIILLCLQPLISEIPYLSDRPDKIKILEKEYLQIIPFYGFFAIINTTISSIFIGILKTKITMLVGIIGHILNAFFSVGLVYGYFYLPELGMAGSSAGTLIAAFISSIIYIKLLYSYKIINIRSFQNEFHQIKKNLINYLRIAIPAGLADTTEIFANAAFIWIAGSISVNAMLALNIVVAINYIAIIPIIGLGIGTNVILANKIGENKENEASAFIKTAVIMSLIYVIIIAVIEQFIPHYFAFSFLTNEVSNSDKELTYELVRALWFFGIGFVFSMIFASVLEAKKKTKLIFWVRLLITWGVSLPVLYYFSNYYNGESEKIVEAWVIGGIFELIVGLILAYVFYKTKCDKGNNNV